ncbi:MAG: hypothetical protein RL653_3359 [Pseudomonadota bacterium]|jgi:hypothetical protein
MPRLPARVASRLRRASAAGARLGPSEVERPEVTEARAVAGEAVDAKLLQRALVERGENHPQGRGDAARVLGP